MFTYLLAKLRQAGYRWLAFSDRPLYLLFEKMYRYDPRPLPGVVPDPDGLGFLVSDFTHPRLAPYRGLEIAFFNARHAVVYWLPGAAPSGAGRVPAGTHTVTMGGHALSRPLRLSVSKDARHTRIRSVVPQTSRTRSMPGCRIDFRILEAELHCLARHWLNTLHERAGGPGADEALREVLAAARALTGFDDLVALAQALQARLDLPSHAITNQEGLTDAGCHPSRSGV
ncbi:hypothetical protein [Burkholderia gladioli]|uniref:Uncharacterized protein n=1 Tax=Burkholderia gladioli (strain BSR3) TaxID=999541 RepID=F2LRR2_BURGS|nr:hypothetical protein [Burkholderia gladioli]AEA65556.1 hypothetical protein bgla_1p1650 [Burkholderia gladioli BSR3]MBW5286683.1 hypothetical protein [Burkholderia gladioli]